MVHKQLAPVENNPFFIYTDGIPRDSIYVANSGSNTVSVIDPDSNTVNHTIDVEDNPKFIEKLGDYIYVANYDSGTISVINTHNNTVIKNIIVGKNPSFIETFETHGSGDSIYVANFGSNTISVINTHNKHCDKEYNSWKKSMLY